MGDSRTLRSFLVLALAASVAIATMAIPPVSAQDAPPAEGTEQGDGGDGGAGGGQGDQGGGGDGGDADADPADGAPDEEDDNPLTDPDTVRWVVIGIVAIVAMLVVGAVASSMGRQRNQAQAHRDRQRMVRNERLGQIIGGAQWVHDQVSLEVLSAGVEPRRLQMNWEDTRRRIYDLGSEATAVAVNSDPETELALRDLSRSLGSLVGAIDTNVGLRVGGDPDDASMRDALRASNDAVQARRAELAAAVVPLRQMR